MSDNINEILVKLKKEIEEHSIKDVNGGRFINTDIVLYIIDNLNETDM